MQLACGCAADAAPPSEGAGGALGGSGGAAAGDAAAGGTQSAGGGTSTGGAGGTQSVSDSGAASPDAAGLGSTKPIPAPPVYQGSLNNGVGCTKTYITNGFEPDDDTGERYPLFLYFTGTNFFADEVTFREQSAPAAMAVTEAMARRGFVALWVEYDNGAIAWLSDHQNQLQCLFGEKVESALEVACALPQVDCDLGIAMWGHSQGAYVAHSAANHDARLRAAWLTGYGGDATSSLAKNRMRVVNGQNDTTNGTAGVLNGIAGFTPSECPDDGRSECLRDDGSGWVIVRPEDCQVSTADHCWFDRVSCTDEARVLEPNWIDPQSQKAFALESNADWVAATTRRP